MSTLREIIQDHIQYRKQIWKLAKSDLSKQYSGSALGWLWALIRPCITIFVFWFAFSIGIRNGKDVDGFPFFLWMIAGFVPWFFMKESLNRGAGSIRKYKYLVKRIKYPVDTIPTFVCLSNLLSNLALQCVMILIYVLFGHYPTIYYLQIPFYILLMYVFFTAWGLFAGMLSSMSKDFLNLVKSVTQALFWLSGILYDPARIKVEWLRDLMLWNPVTIIASGYRNCMIYGKWFWEEPILMRNFSIVLLVMIVLAIWSYHRLKKEIPDVL